MREFTVKRAVVEREKGNVKLSKTKRSVTNPETIGKINEILVEIITAEKGEEKYETDEKERYSA